MSEHDDVQLGGKIVAGIMLGGEMLLLTIVLFAFMAGVIGAL